jgi:hypothetical protein
MLDFKKILILTVGCMCGVTCMSQSQTAFEQAVRTAVNNQMTTYPQSTLRDIYKNFFQDRFGPGHLIPDTAASGNYLRRELASFDKAAGAYFEPAGWEGAFYRVNLSVIKEKLVPYEVYFDAFVRSVNGLVPPTVEDWEKEWLSVDAIIRSMDLPLADCEADRTAICELLKKGEYVMHHSAVFEANYSPHYRIIEKGIFEKEIRPFLPESNQ